MASQAEKSQPVALWIPSKWTVLAAVPVAVLAWKLGLEHPPARYWLALPALAAVLAFELLILPRISLAKYRFCLMRLESRQGSGTYPDSYICARVSNSRCGFGWVNWKSGRGIQPGDIVAAVTDSRGGGVALIPLRTEGRLPVIVWFRDLYQERVLAPLPRRLRELAHQFDEISDVFVQVGDRFERSRALRSRHTDAPAVPARDPEAAWKDVVLPEAVKSQLMAVTADFAAGRSTAPRGVLLSGPPGTGKTLVARAMAESLGCAFFPLTLPDLKATYIGESGERVKALWEKALAEPRAVIFVDECDGVFSRRGGINADKHTEDVVNAFIARWDGFSRQTSVLVVGATNRQDLVDPAVLSRFDEQVWIGLPDDAQREGILRAALERLGVAAGLPAATAELTAGLSGRDIAGLARRLARDIDAGATFDGDLLERHATGFRRQGSTPTDTAARWDTLVLSDATLKELKATAGMLAHAEAFRSRGIAVPRGMLLYGPPGTGKTQVARTLANETGLRFVAASTADIKQGWLGQSGQKVKELFDRAREAAPALLFIDEIDVIAGTRGSYHDSIMTEIVGQLLQEMDGIKAGAEHVFVLAATNRVDQIDPAVLSRLPRRISIPMPDAESLQRLAKVMLDGKPLAFDLEQGAAELARRARGCSGRDLRGWIEHAEQNAVVRAMDSGDPDSIELRLSDFPEG